MPTLPPPYQAEAEQACQSEQPATKHRRENQEDLRWCRDQFPHIPRQPAQPSPPKGKIATIPRQEREQVEEDPASEVYRTPPRSFLVRFRHPHTEAPKPIEVDHSFSDSPPCATLRHLEKHAPPAPGTSAIFAVAEESPTSEVEPFGALSCPRTILFKVEHSGAILPTLTAFTC